MQFGDIGTSVGAVTTGLAILLAAIVFALQLRDKHRAQSELVAAWPEQEHVDRNMPAPEKCYWYGFVCHNQSFGPIYDIEVLAEQTADSVRRAVFRPGALGPGRLCEGHLAVPNGPAPRLMLSFTDAAGRRWQRDFSGRIQKVGRRRGRLSVRTFGSTVSAFSERRRSRFAGPGASSAQ